MDFILKVILIMILGLVVACKGESSQTYVSTKIIEVPTEAQTDSIAAVQKALDEIVEKSIPQVLKEKKEEIREEKKNNSVFRNEGCCSNEPPPALCCCEPVWIKYLELFKSGDSEKIAKVRSEDPILNDCIKKMPSFKKKIDSLEMSGEGEE